MAREGYIDCKKCGIEFGYSQSSVEKNEDIGQTPPEYCPDCQKIHKGIKRDMSMGYFNVLKRRKGKGKSAQSVGAVYHPERPRRMVDNPEKFDKERYSIKEDDVRDMYRWLNDPKHQIAVVKGGTGSGKSTALVRYLVNPPSGIPSDFFTHNGQIFISQPKRISATDIGEHVAELLGSSYGEGFDAGYHIGGERKSDWRNTIVYDTHGVLLNSLLLDQLEKVGIVFIDEAHERTLQLDQVLFLMKKRLHLYPHLKLFIVSATIDEQAFVKHFGAHTAKAFVIQGNSIGYGDANFRPEEEALPYDNKDDLINSGKLNNATVDQVMSILEQTYNQSDYRDILVFSHGKKPIAQIIDRLKSKLASRPAISRVIDIYPLYTELSKEEKKLATEIGNPQRVRVVVSTNIAEASLTVEGVVYVVDTGIENTTFWDYDHSRLVIRPDFIAKANAKQRWGRSGRTRKGIVFTMYTKNQYDAFLEYPIPDIQRLALEQLVLNLKSTGISNLKDGWIDPPSDFALSHAVSSLQKAKALDEHGAITPQGMVLRNFSYGSQVSDLIDLADEFGVAVEVATLLPVIKNGGYTKFLYWDKNWDVYTKYQVWQTHKSLMSDCIDDIEFILKVFSAWEENPIVCVENLFVDEDVMRKILEERDQILQSLTKRKKDPNYRKIQWTLLDRVRIILALVFWEIREQAVDKVSYEYIYKTFSEEQTTSSLSCNCLVLQKWIRAFQKISDYQEKITPMILGKVIMWWEDLTVDDNRVKSASQLRVTYFHTLYDKVTDMNQKFERFAQRFRAQQDIEVRVTSQCDFILDRSSALIVMEPSTGLEIPMENRDLAFTVSKAVVQRISIGTNLQVKIEGINQNQGEVYLSRLPFIQTLQIQQAAAAFSYESLFVVKGTVIEKWNNESKIIVQLPWGDLSKGDIVIVEAGSKAFIIPFENYELGKEYWITIPLEPKKNWSRDVAQEPRHILNSGSLEWSEGKLTHPTRMTYANLQGYLNRSRDDELSQALTDLFFESNKLEADRMFDQAWLDMVVQKFPLGTLVNGTVSFAIMNDEQVSGYIIELDKENKVTGYLSVRAALSELSVNQTIKVKIQRMSPQTGRIGLKQENIIIV